MRAIWNDQIVAESDDTVVVENNHYFPGAALKKEFFIPSDKKTTCPWKGEASYYSIVVNGKQNTDAAFFYPQPKQAAQQIEGRVAFWRGVNVSE